MENYPNPKLPISLGPYSIETSGTIFTNTDRPKAANNVLIFYYGIALKGPKMSKIPVRTIKLTFAMIAFFIGIHDCLNLSKIFTFYLVYDTFKAVSKSLKSRLSWTFRSGPYSEFRPLERARLASQIQGTTEKFEKKINRNISSDTTWSAGIFTFYFVFVLLNCKEQLNGTVTALCPE